MNYQNKLVFSSGVSTDFDIWSLDLVSNDIIQLTRGNDYNDYPQWSPDGSKIAFVKIILGQAPALYCMNADGSECNKLLDNTLCQSPSWSPDGKSLIFIGNYGNPNSLDIYRLEIDKGVPEKILSYDGQESTPTFSPDGKYLLFSVVHKTDSNITQSDIVEYGLYEKSSRVICSHLAHDYYPRYSPDGKKIAFVSHRNNTSDVEFKEKYNKFKEIIVNGDSRDARQALQEIRKLEEDGDLYLVDRDGQNLEALTSDRHFDKSFTWSPCGKFILFCSSSRGSQHTDRFKLYDIENKKISNFNYDRSQLEREIGSLDALNLSIYQRLIPDVIEKLFIDQSFFGTERHPHWI